MTMKLDLIGREVIKPASPTPDHVRTIQLSLFDQFLPKTYVSAIFFYDITAEKEIVSTKLKSSLSQVLTRFYPLAGRIEDVIVNCNDEGALFTESRADMLLSDFLRNPDAVLVEQLISQSDSSVPGTWPLLRVNVTFFNTGGVAIAISVSHKLCDAHSLMMFIRGWTATAQGYADALNPEFVAATFYPPADLSLDFCSLAKHGTKFITKRFVFGPSILKELKSRAASENVMDPTRVEVTMGLLLKCVTKASRSNLPCVMTQAMNLRPKTPLLRNAFGNFFFLPHLKEGPERETKIQEMVTKLRKSKEDLDGIIKESPLESRTITELGEAIVSAMLSSMCEIRPEMIKIAGSSWCRMPFYEADFGWGRPLWTAAGRVGSTEIILMDANDGEGIEAWVTLTEQVMSAFEHDQDLLAFADPNPSVLI